MLNWLVFIFSLLLPASWAKHWLTPFSLVNGVLVDYLMPDLWLQDILALIIIVLGALWAGKVKFSQNKLDIRPYLLPVVLIVISGLFSQGPLVSIINLARFLLAIGVSRLLLENKSRRRPALLGLAGAVIWTGLLAVGQFVSQGTIFGWRFLGEPIFSLGTGGVKKISLFRLNLVAPMATFPHANVMGAFGLLTFLVLRSRSEKIFQLAKIFSLVLVVLSFSIPIYLILFYLIVSRLLCTIGQDNQQLGVNKKLAGLVLSGLGAVFFLIMFYKIGFLNQASIYRRLQVIPAVWKIIKDNIFFGVGWGTFVKKLPEYADNFHFLQPVHNLFLLVPAELGVIGAGGLVLLVRQYFKNLKLKNYLLLIAIYLLLFMFDHYFWTTTQGIYLLWVMIGLF